MVAATQDSANTTDTVIELSMLKVHLQKISRPGWTTTALLEYLE